MVYTFQWFMVFLEQLMFTNAQPDSHTSLHMAQVFSCVLTDIDQRSQTGVIFRHGVPIGGICLFSCDQSNHDLLAAYILRSEH